MRRISHRLLTACVGFAMLASCGGSGPKGQDLPADEMAGDANALDPLLASVVQDPLMTDLQLATRSNANAIRPPDQPYTAMVPLPDLGPTAQNITDASEPSGGAPSDDGECAACASTRAAVTLTDFATSTGDPRLRACAPRAGYDAGWALQLPPDLPLPAGARVTEAAGANGADCRLRATTFAIAQPAGAIATWYADRARAAGYANDAQSGGPERVIAGRRASDGAAFRLYVRDNGGSSTVTFVANTGS